MAKRELTDITAAQALGRYKHGLRLRRVRLIGDLGSMVRTMLRSRPELAEGDGSRVFISIEDSEIMEAQCRALVFPWAVSFIGTTFQGAAEFSHATFSGGAEFDGATFHDLAWFRAATFARASTFSMTTFAGSADFRHAKFLGYASFEAAAARSFEFSDSCFQGGASMGVRYADRLDFTGAAFESLVQFRLEVLDEEEVPTAEWPPFVEELRLDHAAIERVLDLRSLQFGVLSMDGAVVHGRIEMTRDQLARPPGRRLWGIPLQADVDRPERHFVEGDDASLARQYNLLEIGCRNTPSTHDVEDFCHYKAMHHYHRARGTSRLLTFIYKHCYGYGVKPWRIARAGAGLIVLFGLVYALTLAFGRGPYWDIQSCPGSGSILQGASALEAVGRCVYFSAITFATIGYGDMYPVGWLKAVAALEGLMGLFIWAIFAVSWARKLLR